MLDGRLSLLTPEGVRLVLTPAGPAVRAWAWALDLLVWAVLVVVLRIGAGVSGLADGLFYVALFVSYWGYPILAEVYGGGRTLGKLALGIRVLRADGLPVGWRESVVRNLLLVADFLPMFYLTGLISMCADARFRRLGDLVAGTQVVYRDAAAGKPAASEAEPLPLPYVLTPEQQRMLLDLFERERQLPLARLEELGTLAEPLTGLTGRASIERLRAYAAGLTR